MELKDLIIVVSLWVTLVVGLMCGYSIRANGETLDITSAGQTSAPSCAGPCEGGN